MSYQDQDSKRHLIFLGFYTGQVISLLIYFAHFIVFVSKMETEEERQVPVALGLLASMALLSGKERGWRTVQLVWIQYIEGKTDLKCRVQYTEWNPDV